MVHGHLATPATLCTEKHPVYMGDMFRMAWIYWGSTMTFLYLFFPNPLPLGFSDDACNGSYDLVNVYVAYFGMYVCIWTVYVFRLWSFYAKSSESKEPMSKHQETHLAGCCPRKIESQHPILWADSPANKFLNLVYQAFGIVNSQQSQAPSIQIHHPLTD